MYHILWVHVGKGEYVRCSWERGNIFSTGVSIIDYVYLFYANDDNYIVYSSTLFSCHSAVMRGLLMGILL